MRCDQCNKFVSFDTDTEPEIREDLSEDGVIEIEARIVNTCAECSQEMTEAHFNFDESVQETIDEHRKGCDSTLSLSVEATRTDRRQTIGRNGRVIPARYQRQFYGVDISWAVRCDTCDTEIATGQMGDEVQASEMDELI